MLTRYLMVQVLLMTGVTWHFCCKSGGKICDNTWFDATGIEPPGTRLLDGAPSRVLDCDSSPALWAAFRNTWWCLGYNNCSSVCAICSQNVSYATLFLRQSDACLEQLWASTLDTGGAGDQKSARSRLNESIERRAPEVARRSYSRES
jgi:hypothetical protein